MGLPDKFDESFRDKLEGYEAEPSAKVWMHVREAVADAPPKSRAPWYAMAAAIALLIGLGAWYYSGGGAQEPGVSGEIIAGNPEDSLKGEQPAPLPLKKDNLADGIEEVPVQEDPGSVERGPRSVPQPNRQQVANSEPGILPELIREQEEEKLPDLVPQLFPKPKELIADDHSSDPRQEDIPVEEYVPELTPRENYAEVGQGQSRRVSIPRFIKQTQEEGIGKSSKDLLGTVAQSAGEKVGLETDYQVRENEEGTQTAFQASIGRFKFRRVKNK